MSVPETQGALVVKEKGSIHFIDSHPVPKLGDNDILLKVKAVSLNPSDWKCIDMLLGPGCSIGGDYVGEVIALGETAKSKGYEKGEILSGIMGGGYLDPANGAFQEYARTNPETSWKVPKGVSESDAAVLAGVASSTAVLALFYRLGLPKPWLSKPSASSAPVLIYGGSTSVGIVSITLAKLAGVPVVTTCSPRNFDLVKGLGADAVFDYKDPEVVHKIREWAHPHGGLKSAFDCVSEQGSTTLVTSTLSEGGKAIIVQPSNPEKGDKWPNNAEVVMIMVSSTLELGSEDNKSLVEWNKHLPELLESGKFKNPIPTKVISGREGIPDGIALLKSGKVSAQKLTYVWNSW